MTPRLVERAAAYPLFDASHLPGVPCICRGAEPPEPPTVRCLSNQRGCVGSPHGVVSLEPAWLRCGRLAPYALLANQRGCVYPCGVVPLACCCCSSFQVEKANTLPAICDRVFGLLVIGSLIGAVYCLQLLVRVLIS